MFATWIPALRAKLGQTCRRRAIAACLLAALALTNATAWAQTDLFGRPIQPARKAVTTVPANVVPAVQDARPRIIPPTRPRMVASNDGIVLTPDEGLFYSVQNDIGNQIDRFGQANLSGLLRWDPVSARCVVDHVFGFHPDFRPREVQPAADGKRWLITGADSVRGVWDREQKQYVVEFPRYAFVDGCLNASGSIALMRTNQGLSLVTIANGAYQTRLLTTDFKKIEQLAMSGDGSRYALIDRERGIWLASTHAGQPAIQLEEPDSDWKKLVFSPNGKHVVALGRGAQVWSVDDGSTSVTLMSGDNPASNYHDVLIAPDSQSLAIVEDFHVSIWDMATGRRLYQLDPPSFMRNGNAAQSSLSSISVQYTADGQKLHAARRLNSIDTNRKSQYWLWDLAQDDSQNEAAALDQSHTPISLQPQFSFQNWEPGTIRFAADGNSILGGWGWVDLNTGEQIGKGSQEPCWLREDGKVKIARSPHRWGVQEWLPEKHDFSYLDLFDAKYLDRFPTASPRQIAAPQQGDRMATTYHDETLVLWRVELAQRKPGKTGRRFLRSHVSELDTRVLFAAFPFSGNVLFAGTRDGVELWNPISGMALGKLAGPQGEIHLLRFSADDRLLATFGSQGLQVWQLTVTPPGFQAACLQHLTQHGKAVEDIAFSRDGARMAVACQNGAPIIYDTTSGKPLVRLAGAESGSQGVAFSSDGKRIAATANDNTLRIYQLP